MLDRIWLSIQDLIDRHLVASNPHGITKTIIGLGNVTNDEQIPKSIGTTKGDIMAFSASGTPVRLGVGTNDQVLTADSTQTEGVKWADASGGMDNPMTTAGDVIYGGVDGAPTRLAKGTASQVLTMNSGATAPEWADASGGMDNPMTTAGDVIYGGVDGAPTRLAKGTASQVLTMNSGATAPEWADIPEPGDSRWTALEGYTATPVNTSDIYIDDVDDDSVLINRPIKFKTGGKYYFALVSGFITGGGHKGMRILGAPLTESANSIQELYYGTPEMIRQEIINIPGYWADGESSTLLASDLKIALRWGGAAAYLVRVEAQSNTDDSGANKARVNVNIAGSAVLTTNANAGLEIAADATWYSSGVDINTSNYNITFKNAIEISTDANGTNDDSSDLTVILTFVHA